MTILGLSIAETFGRVAGIGGLSLLVFAWLFREVIRKNIFPEMGKIHAYKIIRLFMILVSIIALSGIAAWVWSDHSGQGQDPDPPKESATAAINKWFSLIDNEKYLAAWESMPSPYKENPGSEVIVELFENERKAKGRVLSRVLKGTERLTSIPGAAKGEYEARLYLTEFSDGSHMLERLVAMWTPQGWKIASHLIFPENQPTQSQSNLRSSHQ